MFPSVINLMCQCCSIIVQVIPILIRDVNKVLPTPIFEFDQVTGVEKIGLVPCLGSVKKSTKIGKNGISRYVNFSKETLAKSKISCGVF